MLFMLLIGIFLFIIHFFLVRRLQLDLMLLLQVSWLKVLLALEEVLLIRVLLDNLLLLIKQLQLLLLLLLKEEQSLMLLWGHLVLCSEPMIKVSLLLFHLSGLGLFKFLFLKLL
jgi:hypothetical protein